jgi:membrane-bound serine protease (ClpP class)
MRGCESQISEYRRLYRANRPRKGIRTQAVMYDLTRPFIVLAVTAPAGLILAFLLWAASVARHRKQVIPAAGIVGLTGRADTVLDPEGAVRLRGELWRARAQTRIAAGQSVRVIGFSGAILEVVAASLSPIVRR